jgi:hypothetical protein
MLNSPLLIVIITCRSVLIFKCSNANHETCFGLSRPGFSPEKLTAVLIKYKNSRQFLSAL